MRINLADLTARLHSDHPTPPLIEHRAIHFAPTTVPGYVPTDVYSDNSDPLTGPVLLISAPGAMGKSEAAKYLASRLNTVYVDLAQINVGNGTLVGELLKAFGAIELEKFREAIQNGRASLILDSTDEAQLRSGSENYFEFLKDLKWFINATTPRTGIILLGRSDSVEMTAMALKLIDIAAPVWTLQPLRFDQTMEFIDKALDVGAYNLHRVQPEPAARLREAVFSGLAGALTSTAIEPSEIRSSWDKVSSFLGYPPVLLAITERLRVQNPQAEISRVSQGQNTTVRRQRGELLRQIVEAILDRESNKVQSAVNESLGVRETDPHYTLLYTRTEQAARILDLTGTEGVIRELPVSLDADEYARYEALISPFVQDHPFVRGQQFANIVFSDYLRAWAVTSPISELYAENRASFLASLPTVGPFFAQFVTALSSDPTSPEIPEDLVDDAIRSNAMSSTEARAWYYHAENQAPILELHNGDLSQAEEAIEFRVTESSGILMLRSPHSHLAVFSELGVVLHDAPSGELDLGPDVIVIADELEIDAKVIRVGSAIDAAGPTLLAARTQALHGREIRVVTYHASDLLISWPAYWNQWNAYVLPRQNASTVPYDLTTQVVVAVRKILRSFRSTSKDTLAVSADKVDRLLVGKNAVAQSVLIALEELHVVSRVGNQFHLDLSTLGSLGLSWHDLHSDNPYSALAGVCKRIVEQESFVARHLTS